MRDKDFHRQNIDTAMIRNKPYLITILESSSDDCLTNQTLNLDLEQFAVQFDVNKLNVSLDYTYTPSLQSPTKTNTGKIVIIIDS